MTPAEITHCDHQMSGLGTWSCREGLNMTAKGRSDFDWKYAERAHVH